MDIVCKKCGCVYSENSRKKAYLNSAPMFKGETRAEIICTECGTVLAYMIWNGNFTTMTADGCEIRMIKLEE